MTLAVPTSDALSNLRQYAALAPWSLRDLSALAGAILEASAIYPINAAASAHPSERTIRFYVARTLVSPPEGRGTAAIYGYRHLLQVVAARTYPQRERHRRNHHFHHLARCWRC